MTQRIRDGDSWSTISIPLRERQFVGKSIVLVGNRKPVTNLSKLIEAHDFVFRFSYIRHIQSSLIGRRTDGIHIEATDGYRDSLAKGADEFCHANMLMQVRLVTMRRMWYSHEVLQALGLADRELLILNDTRPLGVSRPTSGFRLIVAIMSLPFFSGAKLSICGFTTDVAEMSPDLHWHHESLSLERTKINRLIQLGRIRCLDKPVADEC